ETLKKQKTIWRRDLYESLQAHLHWGNGTAEPGSEHTVDGKRFPMELHIVNSKSTYNRNATLAVKDSEGLAALGFFIEVSRDDLMSENFFIFSVAALSASLFTFKGADRCR
uniref:Carbonic anhydrase n=1 Tax=Xiphophorus couchianus TaxID=32473 RepID=A0A3B5KYA5_9TELE